MKHDQTAAVVHFVASWVFVLFACISSGSGLAQFAWYSSSDGLLWPWTGASLVQVGAFLFLATADSAQLTLRVRVAQLLAHLLALCITANDITVWCSALLFLVSVSVPLSVAAKHSELNMHDASARLEALLIGFRLFSTFVISHNREYYGFLGASSCLFLGLGMVEGRATARYATQAARIVLPLGIVTALFSLHRFGYEQPLPFLALLLMLNLGHHHQCRHEEAHAHGYELFGWFAFWFFRQLRSLRCSVLFPRSQHRTDGRSDRPSVNDVQHTRQNSTHSTTAQRLWSLIFATEECLALACIVQEENSSVSRIPIRNPV